MKKYYLIACLCLIFSPDIFTQNEKITQLSIDTIPYMWVKHRKADSIRKMLESDQSLKGWSKYYAFKAFAFLKVLERDSAAFYSRKVIEIYENEEKDFDVAQKAISKAYYMIGLHEYFNDEKLKSIETLYKALEYAKKYPEKEESNWETSIIHRISIIHLGLGDYNLSLKYKLKLLPFENYMSYQYTSGNLNQNIGILYSYKNDLDSAKYYLRKSIQSYTDTTKNSRSFYKYRIHANVVNSLNSIGNIHLREMSVDSAKLLFKKANDYYDYHNLDTNYKEGTITYRNQISKAYLLIQENKLDDAFELLQMVYNKLDADKDFSRNERDMFELISQHLVKIYQKLNDIENIIRVKNDFIYYLNEYQEKNIAKQFQEYTTYYEVKEKDNSIKELEKQNESQAYILKQRQTINFILGFGVLLLITITIFVFRQRKLKNMYRLVNLEQRLLRSQLNPHFIFNALNSISGLAKSKSEKTVPFVLKFSSLLRLILKNSREEFISLEDEIQALNDYLELQSNFSNRFVYSIIIDETIDPQEILIPPMFIQPFIENSINHGFNGISNAEIKMEFRFHEKDELLECLIVDNGIGYNKGLENRTKNRSYESLSGKILKERLKVYAKSFDRNAVYHITDLSESVGGTAVNLYLPYFIDS